jgi:hypothetical protein
VNLKNVLYMSQASRLHGGKLSGQKSPSKCTYRDILLYNETEI